MPFPATVKCAVFDLDGTLLDSLADLAGAANALLLERSFPVHPLSAYRRFVGDGAPSLVRRILPESHQKDDLLISQCLEAYYRHYAASWNHLTRPYPGILELLESLACRGIALAVLSNKSHPFTLQCVRELCPLPPGHAWAAVLGLQEGAPPKPHPHGLQTILQHLQVSPSETIYLGDTDTDMQTAVAGGAYPIGVLWGFRHRDELLAAGAQSLLDHPSDLLQILE